MVDVAELGQQLEAFLSGSAGGAVAVSDVARLPGGASRETWSFTMRGAGGSRRLILRRDPPGAPVTSMDRMTEFRLLGRAAAAGVPVPRVLWASDDASVLGSAFFVMDHVDGETIARKILRDDEYASARPLMAGQCGEILARIHSADTSGLGALPEPHGNPALESLERYLAVLDSFGEPHPAFELAMRWLLARVPEPARITLVHGDFRNGNLIVGRDGVRAVLDWELAHLGDPWEDLAWLCVRSWRFGGHGEVGGFGDRADLYATYERTSGVPVDADAVRWWEIFGNVKWGIMCIAQAFTHLWGHVRSLELAAIGRRSVETEHDLMELLTNA